MDSKASAHRIIINPVHMDPSKSKSTAVGRTTLNTWTLMRITTFRASLVKVLKFETSLRQTSKNFIFQNLYFFTSPIYETLIWIT